MNKSIQNLSLPGALHRLLIFGFIILLGSSYGFGVVRDGQVDTAFNLVPMYFGSGRVTTSARAADGKFIIAGNFATVSGHGSKNLARLNANGSYDESFDIGSGPNDSVKKIFMQSDGKILVSGNFTQFNGAARNRIVRLNPNGSIDPTFSPNFGASFVQIAALQSDGKIIVNGNFTSFGGFTRNGLVRLNADATIDQSFDPGVGLTNGAQVQITAVQPDGKIIIGGGFRTFNGGAVSGLLRLNADGTVDLSYNFDDPGIPFGELFEIALTANGKIYLVGVFFSNTPKVVRLTSDGNLDPTFSSNNEGNGRIFSLAEMPDGKVLVGGSFDSIRINGTSYPHFGLFRFNVDGSPDTTFTAQLPDWSGTTGVYHLSLQNNNQILVGGEYAQISGVQRGGLALTNLSGVVDTAFTGVIGTKAQIITFEKLADGKIMVAGNFHSVANSLSRYVVRLNADGTPDNTFLLDSLITNQVGAIAVQPDGKMILGGYQGIWRVNADGSLDSGFNAQIPQFEGVGSIALQADGKILIAGGFSAVNGVNRKFLARLNSDGTLDNSLNVTFGAPLLSLSRVVLQPDGKILISGDFSSVNGQPVANFARLNADGTVDSNFQIGNGANGPVSSILLNGDGTIFVGGNFSTFNGQSKRSLVKLDSSGSFSDKFEARFLTSTVSSIVVLPGGKILVSGSVSTFGNNAQPRSYVIRLLRNGSIDASFNIGQVVSSQTTATIYKIGVLSENQILAVGFFDSIGGVTRGGVARLNINFRIPRPIFDFDGDGKTDISVFRPSNGVWYWLNSFNNFSGAVGFGFSTDKVVAEDFDGDFRTDVAVFRPSTGVWYVFESGQNQATAFQFGLSEDIPAPGDFDGDGRADYAVFRPSTGVWYLWQSQSGFASFQFGLSGDVPAVGDYDGDGKADAAIYRPSNGQWWLNRSTNGVWATQFGDSTDKPVVGDYTGDGKADVAFWRGSTGEWFVLRSEDYSYYSFPFGTNGDTPAPGDYDGDEKLDPAVFRPSTATWFVNRTTAGLLIRQFGFSTDRPVPSPFEN
jgi:uncharacterized delta-60 repeat protein